MSNQVEIMINPVQLRVLTLDTGLVQILDNKFKYKVPSRRYSPKIEKLKKMGIKPDEYRHFFSKKKQTLNIGFKDELIGVLKDRGYEPVFEDLRKIPPITIPDRYDGILANYDWEKKRGMDAPPEFRYFQIEAFDKILKEKNYSGIIEGATAFGKTFVFLALTQMISERILIIFPGVQLVHQTYKDAKLFGIEDIGMVSGQSRLIDKRIMLVNYQSLEILEGYENIKQFKTVFVDEMHKAKAKTLFDFLKKIPASIRLGFSATPFKVVSPTQQDKLDNALNKANIGEIIYRKKAKDLIDEGYLSFMTINFLRIDQPYKADYFAYFIKAKEEYIVKNEYRNNIIKQLTEMNDKRTLIIVELREHGEILNEMIKDSVHYVHGDTNVGTREEVRDKLDSGELKRVISTIIFNEGIDIPNLERMIVACSGKSFYRVIQRIGRGLRKTKEVDTFEVWDFIDVTNKYLDKWSQKRWEIYNYEGHPINAVKMSKILGKNKDNSK